MKTINTLLERFKKIQVPNDTLRREFKQIVFDRYSIEIPFSKIKVQNNIIYFSAPSVLKQEVILDKKAILASLNKKLNTNIKDLV